MQNFKELALDKQVGYFKDKHNITKYSTVKRRTSPVKGLMESQDAMSGVIFYEGYRKQILDRIEYLKTNKLYSPSGMMMSHILRSEHIPWNLFFPMTLTDDSLVMAKNLFNEILQNVSPELHKIAEITDIIIEYAPKDKRFYLNDGTSFDTFVLYKADDGRNGGIGIEVKYTEKGYSPSVKESNEAITDYRNHSYWKVMNGANYFNQKACNTSDGRYWSPLVKNDLRQIWRNHLLGAAMIQRDDISHFLSMHLYPSGNTHFHGINGKGGAVDKYRSLLSDSGLKSWTAITFEQFFSLISHHFTSPAHQAWHNYLTTRYIF